MRIERLLVRKYDLPLQQPLHIAGKTIANRRGFLIWLVDDEDRYGLGEAAPLPSFSTESLSDVAEQLRRFARQIREHPVTVSAGSQKFSLWEPFEPMAPSARFGLDMASLDLCGKAGEKTVRTLLARTTADSIPVNGLIGLLPAEVCARKAVSLVSQGFTTLKLKMGRPSPKEDVRCVWTVSDAVGEKINLRLDPNQAWDRRTAEHIIPQLDGLAVEYLEQPIPFDRIEELRSLRDGSTIPIALDEMPTTAERVLAVIAAEAVDAVILKPTILGSIRRLSGIIARARQCGMKTVFTSTLESAVGLAGVAQLAAAFVPDMTHGLSTGSLFARQNLSTNPYSVAEGRLHLPVTPGLGLALQPDEARTTL